MIRDEDSAEVLAQQETAIDAMSRLLNALLDISKLESGAIQVAPAVFEVGALFDDMRREFGAMARNKGLSFSIDDTPECVRSDPALIGQVLRNLLSNAIKYTPQGRVELRCARQGAQVAIEVRDSGVGHRQRPGAADLRRVLPGGREPEFIARWLWVRASASCSGSRASWRSISRWTRRQAAARPSRSSCPRRIAPPPNPRANPRPAPDADAGSDLGEILLVEDEPGVRNAMRMLLKLEGYRVTPAATAQEAFDRLRRGEHFDLLITDYHLDEGRTGTQVIATAREMNGPGVKAILVTGDTSSAVREIQGDSNLRITSKPINSGELLALVKGLIAG